MNIIGQPERTTQNRVIALFRDELHYRHLGNWTDRDGNSNIDEGLLTAYLTKSGYTPAQISRASYALRTEADNANRGLVANNQAVYSLLRYGVPVKIEARKVTETVHLINWTEPEKNDFAIAEEVTLHGNHDRRPDLVLYVNGIAIGVLELKNSRVSIGDGIRQSLSNQRPEFNAWFFSTVQLIFAGNDSEGLKYGSIGTEEKYFLKWKEDEQDDSRFKLDKYLLKMCEKSRLTELMHDFVLFDGGVKKLPRVHQYFGIKAAQRHAHERRGGIIWHTQGSGKSIVMVLLAKWILEHNPNARVAIITDRDELDKQIERVFTDAGETIYRTSSGRDLMSQLGQATPRLLCSLVHKFGRKEVDNFEQFIRELAAQPSQTVGEVFVFVDECHRTQSGKLHRVMKALLPNAVFIGFTGTPLLKKDKATSLEVFGGYIHTYKFSEAVEDAVAETIENNVRSKIIKEHLNDPAYYEKMSALLAEIIAARNASAIKYEEYLKRIAELAKKVEAGQAPETPQTLDTPGKRALFNNLKTARGATTGDTGTAEPGAAYARAGDQAIELVLRIDATVRQVRPDDWRGVQSREQVIKAALYGVLQDMAEVERIFLIVKAQREY